MAIAGKPNSEWIMEVLEAEFKEVRLASGYRTDVNTVKFPEYAPDDEAAVAAEKDPAVLLWIESDGHDPELDSIGETRSVMLVTVLGVVKQRAGLQKALTRLGNDIKRVMRLNPQRNHPTYTGANTWGVNTIQAGPMEYGITRPGATVGFGVIMSQWSVVYRFPNPNG